MFSTLPIYALSYTSLLLAGFVFSTSAVATNMEVQDVNLRSVSVANLKPPPVEKVMVEKTYGKNGSVKKPKLPITATSYTVASLQTATNSFSQESLVGEGSLGRVYRAEFSNGKVVNDSSAVRQSLTLFYSLISQFMPKLWLMVDTSYVHI